MAGALEARVRRDGVPQYRGAHDAGEAGRKLTAEWKGSMYMCVFTTAAVYLWEVVFECKLPNESQQ